MSKAFLLLVLAGFAAVFAATWAMTAPPAVPAAPVIASGQPATSASVSVGSCEEAREKGLGPFYGGQPGYRPDLDPDGDGLACPPM